MKKGLRPLFIDTVLNNNGMFFIKKKNAIQ